MARFTVRIELRNVHNRDGYQQLHEAMKAVGFSRRISRDGKQYQLPTAEYRMVGKCTRKEVRHLARQGAAAVGFPCSVLVTEGPCSWYNLAALAD